MRGQVINIPVYQRVINEFEVMRKYDAVGLSEQILLNLKSKGVHLIRIVRMQKDAPTVIYFTTVAAFLVSSLKHEHLLGDINLFVPFSNMLVMRQERQAGLET